MTRTPSGSTPPRSVRVPDDTMTNRTCTVKNCRKPALWRLDCTDHPNGGHVSWCCQAHLFLPAWEAAPAPYTMTVSGPHR